MEKKDRIISQEVLKIIACLTMLIDHFGAAVIVHLPLANMVTIYYICRGIGRIAFPIYCFLLAEGMRHTRNAGKYILRLAVGILLAEVPFDFLFEGGFSWAYQSVMVTLTLGAIMLWCMKKTKKKFLQLLLILPFAAMAEIAKCDYGGWGIAMIAVFALLDRLPLQFLGLLFVSILMPSAAISVLGISVSAELAALFAMIPIGFYSGQKLTHSRAVQWAFYLFYPVHMLVLWIVLVLLG